MLNDRFGEKSRRSEEPVQPQIAILRAWPGEIPRGLFEESDPRIEAILNLQVPSLRRLAGADRRVIVAHLP